MKVLEMRKATAPLERYARRIRKNPMVLTVQGKPVAALVAITNADWETVTLSTDPQFLDLVERSRSRQKTEGGVSGDDMRRRLGLKKRRRG